MLFSNSLSLEAHCNTLEEQSQMHVVDGATTSFETLIGDQQDDIFIPGVVFQQAEQTVVIKYPESLSGLQHRAMLEILLAGHYTGFASVSATNPADIILMFESDSPRKLVGEAMNHHGCASLISAVDLISPSYQQVHNYVSREGLLRAVEVCDCCEQPQSISLSDDTRKEIPIYAENFYTSSPWRGCQVLQSSVRTTEDTVRSLTMLSKAVAKAFGDTTVRPDPHLMFADDLIKLTYGGLVNQDVSHYLSQVFDWCSNLQKPTKTENLSN
jgi:hypothetical protein